ncbi:hypothetical protein [Bacillus fonticola]|uniref:hypothetical protein n=1 Tax=Bacillus fonticola TaxID=2728853 RepID=UPI003898D857
MVQLRSWRKIKKFHWMLRRAGWKEDLPDMRMTAWRSSITPEVHYVMNGKFFKAKNLVPLVKLYDERYLQRG